MGMSVSRAELAHHQHHIQQQQDSVKDWSSTNEVAAFDDIGRQEELRLADWIHENEHFLRDLIANTTDDKITVSVANFMKLLQESVPEENAPPQNYFISSASFVGEAQPDAASLHCSFEVTVLKEKWTSVKLVPDVVALLKSNIAYKSASYHIESNKENPFSPLATVTDTKAEKPAAIASTTTYCIGVVSRSYALIASWPGNYSVELDILVPYATSRKTGFTLYVPKAAVNELKFKVPDRNVQIKADPSLFTKHYKSLENNKNKSILECKFPPTDKLSIQWTESKALDEKSEEKQAEVASTVEQKSLVSIAEGILSMQTLLCYTITSGQMSYFEVEIEERMKVIHVEGMKQIPVKRWEVSKRKAKKSKAKDKDTPGATKAVLKLWLEYGLEDMYEFTIFSELELKQMSCQLDIPAFNSLTSKEVSRETGYIAVETRTNVEVNELKSDELSVVDIREVPDALNSMALNPLLLAYNTDTSLTAPKYKLKLDIKKHGDVEVLIAVIDSGFMTATVSDEGLAMFRLLLLVRNTQKQYVRISVPQECEIWSTLVAGTAVKPAQSEDGKIMIPLLKSSKSDSKDSQDAFQVEFIYLVKGNPMIKSGQLSLKFPFCDIPINQLFVNVFLPDNFTYGEFTGMNEVKYWSKSLPAPTNNNMHYVPKVTAHKRATFANMKYKESFKSYDDNNAKSGGRITGVLPVKVDMPTVGTEFRFEQLGASISQHIALTAPYRCIDKGCCKKRSVGCC